MQCKTNRIIMKILQQLDIVCQHVFYLKSVITRYNVFSCSVSSKPISDERSLRLSHAQWAYGRVFAVYVPERPALSLGTRLPNSMPFHRCMKCRISVDPQINHLGFINLCFLIFLIGPISKLINLQAFYRTNRCCLSRLLL